MIGLLAQATLTEGLALAGSGAAVTIAGLLIKRGFSVHVGKGDGSSRPEWCKLVHESLDKLEKDRHETVVAAIGEVKQSVVEINRNINELIARD